SLCTCRAIGEPALSVGHFPFWNVPTPMDQDSDPTFCICRQKRALFGEGDSEGKNVISRLNTMVQFPITVKPTGAQDMGRWSQREVHHDNNFFIAVIVALGGPTSNFLTKEGCRIYREVSV